MIENLKYDEKTVSWNTKSGKRVEKIHNSISNVLTNSKEVYLKLLEKMKSSLNLSKNGEASLRRMVYGTKFDVIKSCLFRNLE